MTSGERAVPASYLAHGGRSAAWESWIDGLPRLLREVLAEWELEVEGDAVHGRVALVVPVRPPSSEPAVLKLVGPHEEAQHERLALQRWHGNGAVALLRADPRRSVLLLERAGPRDLISLPPLRACEVVAGLYPRLHVPASPQLRPLSGLVGRRSEHLAALPGDAPLPRRLVEQAVALGRAFAVDPATDGVLIHGDLTYRKVLAGHRAPWLAIGPRPMSGDPHAEVAPLLSSRWAEVLTSGDVRGAVRNRFATVVEAASLDHERARDWVVVRQMHDALRCLGDAADRPGGLTAAYLEELTRAVTIAKAVQR